ncbi:low density lipoprotein receptor adapter protein 1-like [Lycorma delicatula]|uniref:low density lipoprotein receptor adapter protein 1-like n=1 Tax=Lycorma delicatula TaxID=130591 RepID=UPI003F51927F
MDLLTGEYCLFTELSDEYLGSSQEPLAGPTDNSPTDGIPSPIEGATFQSKYLGNLVVPSATSEKDTAAAVKAIVTLSKLHHKHSQHVTVYVNLGGILVNDATTSITVLDVSLYRISYCSADAAFGCVFAFIATDNDDLLHCHAFHCPKRKVAQLMSITLAQAFNTAYNLWKMRSDGSLQVAESSKIINGFQKLEKEYKAMVDMGPSRSRSNSRQWAMSDDED